MARTTKLKVYRTPIGFHDAYVAAPSQKAALDAWGSDANLFARGIAEIVTDATLSEEPLANPGKVIRRSRGTTDEQIAALPADTSRRTKPKPPQKASDVEPRRRPTEAKPKSRPDRSALAAAEEALVDAKRRQDEERNALRKREAELVREQRTLERKHGTETARLERRRSAAVAAYQKAMRAWR